MLRLPIDEHVPAVVEAIRRGSNVVVEAAPGAGKTTRVPPALMSACDGEVVVLEPRRIAARMAARRVAEEMGVPLGSEVGYQVRFEDVGSKSTRLRFVTEGLLTRRLVSDPMLRGVSIVVLDEFHERHLDTDLSLALLRRLQAARTDLRLVVMSATLDADPVARFLGDAPRVRSEGRLHPIEIEYAPSTNAPLEDQVGWAVQKLADSSPGDVLVFLPGAFEIQRARRALEPIARKAGWLVTPLYGDLSTAEQDLAVQPAAQRKIILSTNIAESSITIDGVAAVVDSGLARVASDSPWTGLPSLHVAKISRASAEQRAGRAGRTAPGRVIRLYTREDFARRPEFDVPEIRRRELSQIVLDLRAMGVQEMDWFESLPSEAWDAAVRLLERLGADGETARAMARLPLHPRLARLVVEAERRGAGDQGCAAAAVLSAGERLEGRTRHDSPSDILLLIESEWQPNTRRVYDQLRRHIKGRGRVSDEALGLAVLAAFPDRLARRRQGRELVLAGGGGSATLAEGSACRAPLLVAVDVEERRDRGLPLVRLASAVEPEWLIELFPDRVEERRGVEWNRTAERVEAVDAIVFDGLVIDETRGAMPDPTAAARLLAAKAIEADIGKFVDREELTQFQARVEFARLEPVNVEETLTQLCEGRRSFAELAAAGLSRALESRLPVRLDEVAPTRFKLPSGRSAKVEYAIGQTPWVSSRLQDFFGMKETPRVGGVPLVVHLLAPNHRPVQVTLDLKGFWERLYPQVRRELSRRYPKHAWPEKPV
ncbi:MAG TPA: ATP-dependent helicase HrpB [Bryobacteraceae bacterium]|jgi:ATP-dependent helicase HrpB